MNKRLKKLNENTKNLSNLLMNLVKENGLSKTLEITGLNIINLFDRIGNFAIDANLLNEIILELFDKNDDILINKINNYSLYLDSLEGTIRWTYTNNKTNERMFAICTPFWDGNDFLPIDVEGYIKDEDELWNEFQKIIPISPDFNSIEEIIEWFNTKYINTVVSVLDGCLKDYRKKYKLNK